jgi:hypothetical protein
MATTPEETPIPIAIFSDLDRPPESESVVSLFVTVLLLPLAWVLPFPLMLLLFPLLSCLFSLLASAGADMLSGSDQNDTVSSRFLT